MIQTFTTDNMNSMDAMHDARVTSISIHENILKIEYDDLDILDLEGNPLYPYNKVTISYEMYRHDLFPVCEIVFYGKNKYKSMEIEKFIASCNTMNLESYLYRIDSFQGLTLVFDIDCSYRSKYQNVEISFDPIKITYNWE